MITQYRIFSAVIKQLEANVAIQSIESVCKFGMEIWGMQMHISRLSSILPSLHKLF